MQLIELPSHAAVAVVETVPLPPKIKRPPLELHSSINGALFEAWGAEATSPPQQNRRRQQLGARRQTFAGRAPNLRELKRVLTDPDLIERSFGPLVFPHPLYHFQRDGVDFLLKTRPGALLADDMGLGKTVQAIVALRLLFYRGDIKRVLIVAPKSVIKSWERHFREWSPELAVAPLTGPPYERRDLWRGLAAREFQVGVVSYDTVRRDSDDRRMEISVFDVVVADEVQRIKNSGTKRARAMRDIESMRRWGLSGTPLENDIGEFGAVLRFLDPSVPEIGLTARGQGRASEVKQYALEIAELEVVGGLTSTFEQRDRSMDAKGYARPMMLRRRKEEVLTELPELVSRIEYIGLTDRQRSVYDRAERGGISELRSKPRNITNVLQLINELKQICNGVDGSSAKREWLEDYLSIASEEDDKVLVFSQYTSKLPRDVQRLFKLRYAGDLSESQRERVLDEFSSNPQNRSLLMSVRAGGLGINLQAANRVVHFDSWWNPAVQAQATARAHRIGQRKTVFETTLVSTDTIEERIQQLLDQKRGLFRRVVDDLSTKGVAKLLTQDELYGLFGLAAA